MSGKRKARIALVLLILLMPWFFYWLLKGGKHNFNHLGFYGPKIPFQKEINGKTASDTIYHHISNFSFHDQDGNKISSDALKKSFTVFSIFNSSCSECLTVFEKLFFIQDEFKDKDDVQLLSVTNTPSTDTQTVLKKFMDGKHLNTAKWNLITGDSLEVTLWLNQSFFFKTFENNSADYDTIFLVDKDLRLRGMYDGTYEVDIKRLIDEIKVLRLEYAREPITDFRPDSLNYMLNR